MVDYVLEGPRWGTGAQGTGGGTVTWAFDSTIPTAFVSVIQSAFSTWSAYANINFQQVASTATASIDFTNAYLDGLGNTVGNANYSYSAERLTSAEITFDNSEGWHTSGGKVISNQNLDFYVVALHEIGHALGLNHYNSGVEVMNSIIASSVTGLMSGDIAGIQALYGARDSLPTVAVGTGPTPTQATSTSQVSVNSGSNVTAVHRFWDTKTGDHFYTTSAAEKDQIQNTMASYKYEGIGWSTPEDGPNTIDVFRFFDTNTSQHFFTTSADERDTIIKTLPTYQYEGVAFDAYANANGAGSGSVTLERFYNTQTGLHHYAANADEAYAINHGSAGANWIDEGKAFTVHVPTDGMLLL